MEEYTVSDGRVFRVGDIVMVRTTLSGWVEGMVVERGRNPHQEVPVLLTRPFDSDTNQADPHYDVSQRTVDQARKLITWYGANDIAHAE